MQSSKIILIIGLLLSNCLSAAQYYVGNELSKVLAEFTKEWNLGVMGTGESHPKEHLERVNLIFTSNAKLSASEARDLILACGKQMLTKLNRCPKLKNRLGKKYFTIENLMISISFSDKNNKAYPFYAADVFFDRKGVCVYVEDEWGHGDVVLEEKVSSEFLEVVTETYFPCTT